ncbi:MULTISPECIES: AraC family transcriptional regulator [unclassified Clostridium]|jgi:AraC-like DNA-binding protein|uniref:AraC family transcriptional regulator n=1 Tax=unclassified Clostridium TaxID=2614128 RepID=UPI00110670F8|nr:MULTISPECIES: AraC family transcriptional regulator [unclassified Clostridium]
MALQDCALNLNRAGRELQPHGTPDFPCAGYSSEYTDSAGDVVPWHWHEDLEILYVASGCLRLQVPGKAFHLKQGEGAVVNSNILHFAAAEPFCQLHSLVFHPLLVAGGKDSVFSKKYVTPLLQCRIFDCCPLDLLEDSPGEEGPAGSFTAAFDAFYREPMGYEFVVRDELSRICCSLYCHYAHAMDSGEPVPDTDNIRIQKMISFIHEHFNENLDLAQIARAADIGERECLRCFKRAIQTSPMQYLLKYRVTQGASMLLRSPGSSISTIAGMCGFNSPSNFSQMFGRFFKCTPREYRRDK